jgi:uncharacterized protein with HEPN domain
MPPDDLDAARLSDMLVYAREIVQTLRDISFAEYDRDRNLRLATERRIEIIGEAARRVSPAFQAAHPAIPWPKIVAMRHILAHEYGEVKQEVVFRIATAHIPELISQLEPLVPPPPPAETDQRQ